MTKTYDTLSYFLEQSETILEKRKKATEKGDKETEKELQKQCEHIANVLSALRKDCSCDSKKCIPWAELQFKKAKPAYFIEKTKDGEWFGWWDIIDTIQRTMIVTAFSESMLKSQKGISWEVFDKEIRM